MIKLLHYNKLIILFFVLIFQNYTFSQTLSGVMVNSCGTEGANEFLFFKNGGSDLTVSAANIDIRYGTTASPGISLNFTSTLGAPVNSAYISSLNSLLVSGCGITFAYAAPGSNIPANANFIVMNDDVDNIVNYSGWCNAGFSNTIYVVFSTSGNWANSGQFANSASSSPKERYFVTTFNSGTPTVYNYYADVTNGDTNGWNTSTDGDGAFAAWTGSGAASGYSNYPSCTPPIPTSMPIKLASFIAKPTINSEVTLYWQTTSETDFSHFEIQRSRDAIGFESIGRHESQKIESDLLNYSFVDSKPFDQISYYRLKEVDLDGSYSFSKIVSVNSSNTEQKIFTFPNPVNEYFEIAGTKKDEIREISVFNIAGKKIKTLNEFTELIDISDIKAQPLIVEIILKNGFVHSHRILKQ